MMRPLALALLKYSGEMYRQYPYLNLLQWAGEIADPPVFGRRLVHEPGQEAPRHVLMLQGIVDHYILPSIANATSLSLGLDLAGPPLDAGTAELESFLPLASLLPLIGRSTPGRDERRGEDQSFHEGCPGRDQSGT